MLSNVDRATCIRTYQVIYFISRSLPPTLIPPLSLSLSISDAKLIHVREAFNLLHSLAFCFSDPTSMKTYKLLKNGIIDSQFCAGEAEGNKVGKNAYCYAFH